MDEVLFVGMERCSDGAHAGRQAGTRGLLSVPTNSAIH